jgi:hypothetical protein
MLCGAIPGEPGYGCFYCVSFYKSNNEMQLIIDVEGFFEADFTQDLLRYATIRAYGNRNTRQRTG